MASKYSIRDLEQLSGIKAHTLRIWEQRYGILKPERTATNIRWYTADELKKILNISLLNTNGIKISHIAGMSNEEIANKVHEIISGENVESEYVTSLVIAMVEYEEERFEKIFSGCILRLGYERTIEQIILPFLRKIGVMWQTGSINPAQEHFVTNLVRQKIIVAIDSCLTPVKPDARKIVFFLPNGELHELALLYYYYLFKARGYRCLYLGQSVPFDDVISVYTGQKPDLMLTVITSDPKEGKIQGYLDRLEASPIDCQVLASGRKFFDDDIRIPSNVRIFREITDLHQVINELSL